MTACLQVVDASVMSASLISLFQYFVGCDVILTLTLSDIHHGWASVYCENESLVLVVKRSDVLTDQHSPLLSFIEQTSESQ